MNTTYQWKNGDADAAVLSTITPETVVIDKTKTKTKKQKQKRLR